MNIFEYLKLQAGEHLLKKDEKGLFKIRYQLWYKA